MDLVPYAVPFFLLALLLELIVDRVRGLLECWQNLEGDGRRTPPEVDLIGVARVYADIGMIHKDACNWSRALESYQVSQTLAGALPQSARES